MLQELLFKAYQLVGGPFDGRVQYLPEELPVGFRLVKAPLLTYSQCFALAESNLSAVPELSSVRHVYRWDSGQTLTYQGEVREAPAFCSGGGI